MQFYIYKKKSTQRARDKIIMRNNKVLNILRRQISSFYTEGYKLSLKNNNKITRERRKCFT